jgi:adenine phosphoribosyltransferase
MSTPAPTALSEQQRASVTAQIAPLIAAVPDFPKPGILFRDITPLLASPQAFKLSVELLKTQLSAVGATHVIGPESRGFIFGVPLAQALELPFLPARKPGKLPRETASASYSLEYGQDSLELHADDLPAGARVLLIDDLLATGGTAAACVKLVQERGAEVVACAFLIELEGLEGRTQLSGTPVVSLLTY